MRILVVQESDWLEKGPHQSHHLMERLSERGHDVRVIDFEISWRNKRREGIVSRRQVFSGIHKATSSGKTTVVRPPIIRAPILNYFSLIYTHHRELKRQIKEFTPEVIVGFGLLNAAIAINLGKKHGIPFIYYLIDELNRLVPEVAFRGIARLVESFNIRESNSVITINDALNHYVICMGAHPEKTKVIRAGVELERFKVNEGEREEMRARYDFKRDDVVLFFMGWLYEFSGLKEVVLEILKPEWRNRQIKLLIVGTGDIETELRHLITEQDAGNTVVLEKWRPYEEIPRYVKTADICILPAYDNEIMRNIVPIKIYEYMASSKPVISTNLPGIVREFGANAGIQYVERAEEVIQEAIRLRETGRIFEEGRKAWDFVKEFSWEKSVEVFEEVLMDVSEER